ncbi:hypothetical protein DTO063F5_6344 [Paecilomyces variotii]|nr:hypothetical protein DTO063F5_6344 [Paecilomyces variotii]
MRLFRNLVPFLASTVSILKTGVDARSQQPGPINYISVVEAPVINSPSHRVHSLSHFDVTFGLHQGHQRIKLDLEPNHDILSEDAHIQYLDSNGNVKHAQPIDRSDHRVFKGSAWAEAEDGSWNRVGWARISVQRDGKQPLFEGAFTIRGNHHHIQKRSNYMHTRRDFDVDVENKEDDYMIVYRDSDMSRELHSEFKRSLSNSSACQADKLNFNTDPDHPVFHPDLHQPLPRWGAMSVNSLFGLTKRQSDTGGISGNTGAVNLESTIGSTAGCPNTKKVALIGVATDCAFTGAYNSTESARQAVIDMVNTASDLYERSFNVTIGLRNLTISDAECPSTASEAAPWNVACGSKNMTQRLDLFSQWRGQRNDSNAYWTLMTNCPTGAEVGVSWLGQLCNTESTPDGEDTVTGANVVAKTTAGWQVFAHETGHTFGAVHDCDSETCKQDLEATSQCCPLSKSTCSADGRYIMNPSTGDDITQFSPCTIGNICSAMGRNSVKSSCLSDNKGVTTITGSECGNGIVEAGEECDCGGEESCGNNACCDAKTCKFKNGAVCDESNEVCCSSCQFASAGTVCRPSTGSCDIAEKCTGNSGSCPSDSHIPDGESCGSGLTCASGQCTSRDEQCQSAMGDLLNSNSTHDCDSSSCTLSCNSPNYPANTCVEMNQNFLDGTPCSGGGHCSNGRCVGASAGGEIKSWVDDHKSLVIGLAVGIGGLLLFSLLSCLIRRCRQSKRPKGAGRPPPGLYPPPPDARYNGWAGPMPPPPPPAMGQWRGGHSPDGYWQSGGYPHDPPPKYPGPAYGSDQTARRYV